MMITPEQFAQLLATIEKIAVRPYTLTGAVDWPLLLVLGGLLMTVIGVMWVDLKNTLKDGREEWRQELKDAKAESEKAHDIIWDAMRDCQGDCCPRKTRGHSE